LRNFTTKKKPLLSLKINRMSRLSKTVFVLFFLCQLTLFVQSQSGEQAVLQAMMQSTSNIYGSDEALINGFAYLPMNRDANGHPFFFSDSFASASIQISDKVFDVESLKYDIADERLVLLVTLKSGAKFPILLNNTFIQQFTLNGAQFRPAQNYFLNNETQGFVDLIYAGSFTFVTKYKKDFIKMFTKVDPFGKYSETQINHYLIRDGIPNRIRYKKQLLNAFAPHQKEISRYMKLNKIKFRKAAHQQLVQLLTYCDELSKK